MKKLLLATLLISSSVTANCYKYSDDESCPNNKRLIEFYSKASSLQENESMVLRNQCSEVEGKVSCKIFYAGYLSFGSGGTCTLFSRNPMSFQYDHYAGKAFIRYHMSSGYGFQASKEMCKKVVYEENWDYIESEEEKIYNAEVAKRREEYIKKLEADKVMADKREIENKRPVKDDETAVKTDEEYRKEFEKFMEKKRLRRINGYY